MNKKYLIGLIIIVILVINILIISNLINQNKCESGDICINKELPEFIKYNSPKEKSL